MLKNGAKRYSMTANSCKTKCMLFNKKNSPNTTYTLSGTQLENVSSFKLLGVWFHDSTKWDVHVNYIVKKASRMVYPIIILKRSGCSGYVAWKVFSAMVKCYLSYCYPAWINCPDKLIKKIFKVEGRF